MWTSILFGVYTTMVQVSEGGKIAFLSPSLFIVAQKGEQFVPTLQSGVPFHIRVGQG